ncbi:SusC/RagA family TonB-linked outer membrane protein [Bacteroidales bacterium OttesenSCG-928-M11]|nr:SusC/RagA family TonB-linked outer membrane protein [Bacteroidales bacterium OttesenSCG-928-M11]
MTVNGTVIDSEFKEPIIGASVFVKEHPTVGAITNIDGQFTLEAPEGSKTLTISYVGMSTKEIPIKPSVHVVLESGSTKLQEVVVTGMQKVDKRMFTGASTKISAADSKIDGIADISRSLEGRSAGVSVQNVSGTFGTAPKIRVRGATSIYGSSKPLWVVDGVIMEDVVEVSADQLSSGDAVTLISSAIAGLNADDIESFDILKDGSATSIYGARAMAGVVVVTTKRGKAGSSSVNYTGEFTYRMKPNYSNFNISNSQEQMGIYKEMEARGWLEFASIANSSSAGIYGQMYSLINAYNESSGQYGIRHDQNSMNAYLRQAEYRNTDWFDLLFQDNIMQNHSVSISGGNDKTRFYTSASAMSDPGWTLSSNVKRYTFNANAVTEISPTVKLTLLTQDSYREQKAPGTLSQETDVVSGEVKRDFDINPYSYALNTSRTISPTQKFTRNYASFNIFDELENNYIDLSLVDVKFQAQLDWKPIQGLDLAGLIAYRHSSSEQEHHIKDHSNQANAYRAGIDPVNNSIRDVNPFLYKNPADENALPETVLPEGGIYRNSINKQTQVDFRFTGSYVTQLKDKHIINLFVGSDINQTDRVARSWTGYGFVYDDGGLPAYDPTLFKQLVEEGNDYYSNKQSCYRSVAFYTSDSYSYKGKYTINLTGRYEGTNQLGKSRQARWLPTWNVGLAWNMHEESWFNNPILSHATLRTSYSLTGDRGPAWVTNAEPVYSPSIGWKPFSELREPGLDFQLGNKELTYEKKHEFNIGFSTGFLDNRINLEFDYYNRDNYDLIGQVYTQGTGGEIRKYANVADMKSHGVEATISTKNIETKDFSWTTDLTFSKTKNEITNLKTRANVMSLVSGSGYALEGYPVRAIFSIPFVGLNDEGLPQFINQDGEVTITDINFQEYEKLDFLVYEGPSDPTITGGFGNLFKYKNFRLNAFITYSFGNVVRLDPIFSAVYSDVTASPKEFKNRWVLPGDELRTNIPVIASRRQYYNDNQISRAYNAYNYSTERIAKGDFIRMKEISLTYDLPSKLIDDLRLSSASIRVQATNLFLIYADKKLNGQDPEFFNSGGVATPMPKQFTMTVRIGL